MNKNTINYIAHTSPTQNHLKRLNLKKLLNVTMNHNKRGKENIKNITIEVVDFNDNVP